VLKDKYIKSQEISFESMQQSCQFFQDLIVDRLDDLCGQNHSSFASHELKSCYYLDMVKQSTSQSSSATVLLPNLSEQLQPYQKLHEDENSIDRMLDHVADLAKFKNQGTGQFYFDLIVTYMEKFFTAEPQFISGITFILQDFQGLCCKDQSCFRQWPIHFVVLNLWTKGQVAYLTVLTSSQVVHWSQQVLDWLHWHFCII
jgi:hypothetical protein